jgi:hypothetical protein
MLFINKGLTNGEVITLKLSNGEELIGKLVEETDPTFKISRPMVLTMDPAGNIGMSPYLFTIDPNSAVSIYKSAVAASIGTDKQIADAYLSKTSGIALA